jgi:hypothetical protein
MSEPYYKNKRNKQMNIINQNISYIKSNYIDNKLVEKKIYDHGKFYAYTHLWNHKIKKYAVIFDNKLLYYTTDPISAYNDLIFNKLNSIKFS